MAGWSAFLRALFFLPSFMWDAVARAVGRARCLGGHSTNVQLTSV